MSMYVHVHVYVCMCICVRVCVYARVCACVCMCVKSGIGTTVKNVIGIYLRCPLRILQKHSYFEIAPYITSQKRVQTEGGDYLRLLNRYL